MFFAPFSHGLPIKTATKVHKKNHKKTRPVPNGAELLEILKKQHRPMRMDALLRITGLPRHARGQLEDELNRLAEQNSLMRMPGGAWVLPRAMKSLSGSFRSTRYGGGFVAPDNAPGNAGNEIHIPPAHTGGAWNGDRVRVLLAPGRRAGKIIEVLERRRVRVAALVLNSTAGMLSCKAASGDLPVNFSARVENGNGNIRPGCLVELRPEKELAANLWEARLIRVLGDETSPDAQELLVKVERDVPGAFPELALRQARELPAAPCAADMKDRLDMRDIPFVTIDGEDARDFDDAIHVARKGNGWLLRVAIADVAHYCKPDSRRGSLDSEALARGNSWYFPRSVEPMLPQILSNGLCSLKPDEERLAVLVEVPFTMEGEPGEAAFSQIVMRSAARLDYTGAHAFLAAEGASREKAAKNFPKAAIAPMLEDAFGLYKALAKKREERGSLDFDIPEAEYSFDEKGSLAGIGVAQRNDAHRLIEEFMIAANEAVARELEESGLPFPYRAHPAPETVKLAGLCESLKLAGIGNARANFAAKGEATPLALQKILASVKGSPQEFAVNRMCLRAMQQARYQPENTGHFGLASRAYCHFTSPIRRYADLLAHRALKARMNWSGEKLCDREKLREIAERLNSQERKAVECEREMARRLGCLFLRDRIGEVLSGAVSGVANFGIFVEFESMPVEGLIRLADLGDDWFEFDGPGQRLVGMRSGISWRLGQPVESRIIDVDLERMEIRLEPAKKTLPARHARSGHKGKKGGKPKDRAARDENGAFQAEMRGRRGKKRTEKQGRRKQAQKISWPAKRRSG